MQFIEIENNIVTRIIASSEVPEGMVEVLDTHQYMQGDDVRFFNKENGERLSEISAIDKGLIIIGEHEKAYWENGWKTTADYTNDIYWGKETKEQVELKLGETPDDTMTLIEPTDLEADWDGTGWVISDEIIAKNIRLKRDTLIKNTIWRIQRYEREVRLGIPLTEPVEPLDIYIQTLADIPQQEGFPSNIIWPTKP